MSKIADLMLMAAGGAGGDATNIIVEYVSSYFLPSFSGTSFSQSVDTGTNTYSGYTRYVVCAHGNLNGGANSVVDWTGNTPTLGGTNTTVLAELISDTTFQFGYVWSALKTDTTGSLTYALTLNEPSQGAGIFVFNVFVKGGFLTLTDTDVAAGGNGAISLSVPAKPNALMMAAIPQNGTITIGGTAGIVTADKVAEGDVNTNEQATAAFKKNVTAGGVTTIGGDALGVVTGIMLYVREAGPPEYVGGIVSSGVSSLNTSSISGTQAGDVYIAALQDDSYIDFIETPSGWSGMTSGYPEEETSGSIARIISHGTTSGTVTAVHPQGGDPHVIDVMSIVAFRNIGTPPSTSTVQETDSGNEFILNPITVTEENSVILIFAMIDDDSATITEVPDGFTLAVEAGRLGGSMAIMYQLNPSIGSTDDIFGGWSSSDSLYTAAYLIPPPA